MDHILGIDSESYTTGEPFMFCVSNGDILYPGDIPEIFFTSEYENANFMIYNIKYDSGALLYHLPRHLMHTLWKYGEVDDGEFYYKYIPHKMLSIGKGNNPVNRKKVCFWDIQQFFHMSLDNAAHKYLNKRKMEIRTKKFSVKYVNRFWNYIARYCIIDAKLTEELGRYLVDKLDEFGITASSLYSCASISFKYFCDNSDVVTAWRFWKTRKELLGYACDSYEGGKFEMTRRGSFYGYEYDLTSAYPYEIQNLVDVSEAQVEKSSVYRPDAVYGFIRCYIDNREYRHLPCGIKIKNTRVYPAGRYFLTITKAEFEYMRSIGTPVEIVSAYWLFVDKIRYPYRKPIASLFRIKQNVKGKDIMLYNISKTVMNSFYGKTAQCIETPEGKILPGPGWNPVYASIITANTRIQVTKMQNFLKENCLAVHTDSVITDTPLPPDMGPGGLGKFEYVCDGEAVTIASGMYQIGDICASRGFIFDKGDTWKTILAKNSRKSKIAYKQLHVESWLEAMSKNHVKNKINIFENVKKEIDLNCDIKMSWLKRATGRSLLDGLEKGFPLLHIEEDMPFYWK